MNKELREKVARMDNSDTATVGEAYDALEDYIRHVPELLDHIEELQRDVKKWRERAQADHLENGQIKTAWTEQQKRIEELEAEKEDLQQAVWELQDVIDAMEIER